MELCLLTKTDISTVLCAASGVLGAHTSTMVGNREVAQPPWAPLKRPFARAKADNMTDMLWQLKTELLKLRSAAVAQPLGDTLTFPSRQVC